MPHKLALSSCLSMFVIATVATAGFGQQAKSPGISAAAQALASTLTAEQKKIAVLAADSPLQVGWHFIPKDARKGLEMNDMSAQQREATHALLKSLLSKVGYSKTTQIMALEKLLKELQDKNGGKGPIRDHLRYYVTMFGEPSPTSQWGLSFEGHHLSLNYVIKNGEIVSSSPQFFATNPAIVKSENSVGIDVGNRVLRLEETLAFELVNTLSKQQRGSAIIAEKAPREIRAAGDAQPPQEEAVGIRWNDLSKTQRNLLRRLINEYINTVPEKTANERKESLKEGGQRNIHFAWAGAMNPGVGHYYRVQSPTFLIEFVNTQPDADGNPANHIHAVWRDMRGDFAKPIGG